MSLVKEKVLILEDDVYKEMDVRRALQYNGIRHIHSVTNQEEGFQYLYQCRQEGNPVTLIVTDMHYPLTARGGSDFDAGFKFLDRMEQEKMDIPVIICSSRNLKEPRAFGTVWYSLLRDLNNDFREVLRKIKE